MRYSTSLIGGVIFSALVFGCASEGPSDSEVALASNAVLGVDTFAYFRCNATGWGVDDATRLRSTSDPYLFSLLYRVEQDWMVSNGDSCQITETNQFNGWGTAQNYYTTVHGAVTVPGGDLLNAGSNAFDVHYPELGIYKVTANWRQGNVNITRATGADVDESWRPCKNSLVTTVAQSPQALNNVFVGCSNGDVFLSFNGRSFQPNWLKVDTWNTSGAVQNLPDLPVNAIAVSPKDIKTAYVAFAGSKQGHKLWKTGTGGASWIELSSVPLAEIWSISVNPLDPLEVYVFGPGGVRMSPDAGVTWTSEVTAAPLTTPLAAGSTISTVSVAPGAPDIVWVGASNGDVFYTKNATGAQTWVKATHDMPTRAVTHLAVTMRPGQTQPLVYATFDGMYNDSLWVTSNEGFGWAMLHAPNLPTTPMPLPGIYAFYGVSFNPALDTLLYIDGTYGAGMSTSGGTSWTWTATN